MRTPLVKEWKTTVGIAYGVLTSSTEPCAATFVAVMARARRDAKADFMLLAVLLRRAVLYM